MNHDMSLNIAYNRNLLGTNSSTPPSLGAVEPCMPKAYASCDTRDDASFDYLSALARTNRFNCKHGGVRESLGILEEHFDDVVLYNDFVDSLIEKGYYLEDADAITREIFRGLADKNTYKE